MQLASAIDSKSIDSKTVGDPARFRTLAELERSLNELPSAPSDRGRVVLIVRKHQGGLRESLDSAMLTPDEGVPGDAWGRWMRRQGDEQIAVMQRDVAELIANGQPLALSGDNLILELDLSAGNLPTGSRLRVGSAVLEVTPKPHDGCRKFKARFGDEALRFVSKNDLRHLNLRGIYLRVVEAGEVRPGDVVEVISRGAYLMNAQ